MDWLSVGLLLAQDEQKPQPFGGSELSAFLPFVAIAIIFYFVLFRPQQREKATRESMLAALKKNDRVVTIGGMLGTIANISSDGQEVTLKVDDNTRIRMIRSSIQRVVSAEGEADAAADTK